MVVSWTERSRRTSSLSACSSLSSDMSSSSSAAGSKVFGFASFLDLLVDPADAPDLCLDLRFSNPFAAPGPFPPTLFESRSWTSKHCCLNLSLHMAPLTDLSVMPSTLSPNANAALKKASGYPIEREDQEQPCGWEGEVDELLLERRRIGFGCCSASGWMSRSTRSRGTKEGGGRRFLE
jgi:hypothetical protein